MSRSRKKFPGHWICCVRAGEMKAWKRQQNRKIRRNKIEEIPSGSHFKKLNETWASPGDGKGYYPGAYEDDKPWQYLGK